MLSQLSSVDFRNFQNEVIMHCIACKDYDANDNLHKTIDQHLLDQKRIFAHID